MLSIQVCHRGRIYPGDLRDLIRSLCSYMERFSFLFLSCTAPGTQLWFQPHLCTCAALRCLFPAQVRGSKSSGCLGHTYSHRPGQRYRGHNWSVCKLPVTVETSRQLEQIGACSLCWEPLPVSTEAGAGVGSCDDPAT